MISRLKANSGMIFWWLLLFGLRVGISGFVAHYDLRLQSEWGKWMYAQGGLKGLYEWSVWDAGWPNHPPLITIFYYWAHLIHDKIMWFLSNLGNFIAINRLAPTKFMWLYDFANWFAGEKYGDTKYAMGPMIVIKQFMILADGLIAGVIYCVCRSQKVKARKYVLAYLLLPMSWYLSSIWGQSDQLSFLFLAISLALIWTRFSILSVIMYALAINIKPDCVILMPVFVWGFLMKSQSLMRLLIGGLISVLLSFWFVSWYTDSNLTVFLPELLKRMLTTGESLTTSNSFNFWFVFHPNPTILRSDMTEYWGVSAKLWGLIMFFMLVVGAMKLIKKDKAETILASSFVAGYGGWLTMTEMHERYAFFGIGLLLIYSIYKANYFKYFVALSIIYFINLLWVFSFPSQLAVIKNYFLWNYQLIPRLLSLVNLGIYAKVFYEMKHENK